MKLKIRNNMAQKHDRIEIFDQNYCTRSINDFNYPLQAEGSMIQIKVKKSVDVPVTPKSESSNSNESEINK